MKIIRVLVIDDSAFMRKMISDMLSSHHKIKVIGTARNGKVGLQRIKELKPDVVTLDIEMPIMDGLETLEHIMSRHDIPVIMLSSEAREGASKTLQALSLGAIDFIEKPSGQISLNITEVKQDLINKVLAATNVNQVEEVNVKKELKDRNIPLTRVKKEVIIAIGTSTGGQKALQEELVSLPKNIQAPILIVQHMPPTFTKSLANRLNTLTDITVKEATNGELIQKGTAYIAPGNYHMEVQRTLSGEKRIRLTQDPLVSGHRPSVDVLFYSLEQLRDMNKIAVILTGMGKDGSRGAKYLKDRDSEAVVISESKESS